MSRRSLRRFSFSAIARSVMISAAQMQQITAAVYSGFSAIARSVMISAEDDPSSSKAPRPSFSAIARSVMISASIPQEHRLNVIGFSAIARSVMISAIAICRCSRL